jgi:hypothetical protein
MKQYYIAKNNSLNGPLSLEELKKGLITRETLVWHAGLDQWQKAETIDELQYYEVEFDQNDYSKYPNIRLLEATTNFEEDKIVWENN